MQILSVNWKVLLTHSEFYFWYLIPTIIAIAITIKSILLSKERKKYPNGVFTFSIIILILPAEEVLYKIFFTGAWPTYMPHAMIGLAMVLFCLQYFLAGKRKVKTPTSNAE